MNRTGIMMALIATCFLAVLCSCARSHSTRPGVPTVAGTDMEALKAAERKKSAQEINSIIEQDRSIFTNIFNPRIQRAGKQYASLIYSYVGALRKIEFSHSPKAFQIAYLRHIQAWEDVAFEVKNRPEKDILPMLLGLGLGHVSGPLSLLSGAKTLTETSPGQATADQAIVEAKRKIESTWHEVELIALEYDVRFKK